MKREIDPAALKPVSYSLNIVLIKQEEPEDLDEPEAPLLLLPTKTNWAAIV